MPRPGGWARNMAEDSRLSRDETKELMANAFRAVKERERANAWGSVIILAVMAIVVVALRWVGMSAVTTLTIAVFGVGWLVCGVVNDSGTRTRQFLMYLCDLTEAIHARETWNNADIAESVVDELGEKRG